MRARTALLLAIATRCAATREPNRANAYGTVALVSYVVLMTVTLLAFDQWVWYPFWIALGCIFAAERILTVWGEGWRARLLAALILPELLYDLFLQAVFVRSLVDVVLRRSAGWGHVQHSAAQQGATDV
jgi:hypothetical protein